MITIKGIEIDPSSYISDTKKDGSIAVLITTITIPTILKTELKLKFMIAPNNYLLKNPNLPESLSSFSVLDKLLSKLKTITLSSSKITVSPFGIITSKPL